MSSPRVLSCIVSDPATSKILVKFDQDMMQNALFFDPTSYAVDTGYGSINVLSVLASGTDGAVVTLAEEFQGGWNAIVSVSDFMQNSGGEFMDALYLVAYFETSGQAPLLTNIVAGTPTTIELTFNENLAVATALDPGNYVLDTEENGPPTVVSAEMIGGAGVRLYLSAEMVDARDYLLTIDNVTDAKNNAVDEIQAGFVGVGTRPQVASVSVDGSVLKVIFSKDMRQDIHLASRFSYMITAVSTGAAPAFVQSVKVQSALIVLVTASETTNGKIYALSVSPQLVDKIGNEMDPGSLSAAFVGNGTSPKIDFVKVVGPNRVDVKFTESIQDTDGLRNPATWTFTNGLQVLAASLDSVDLTVVHLITTDWIDGEEYDLTVAV